MEGTGEQVLIQRLLAGICKSTTVLCRSKAIICSVPKSSWKRKQIERSENRAMKELEREMREAAKREREVCSNWQLVTS